jgi:hypothetical protein
MAFLLDDLLNRNGGQCRNDRHRLRARTEATQAPLTLLGQLKPASRPIWTPSLFVGRSRLRRDLAQRFPWRTRTRLSERGRRSTSALRHNPQMVPYVASEWAKGGKYYGKPRPAIVDYNFPTTATKEYDFTGRGDIDTEVDQARKIAASTLALQQKYGTQFIEENLKQQALADPESKAARDKLAALVEAERQREAVNPLSTKIQALDREELALGGELSQSQKDAMMATILKRQAMGDAVDSEDVSRSFDVGREARDTQRQQQMLGLLTSGASPDDAKYRKQQQDLANMASFRAGKTPVSQFQSLSGAQTGATPQMGTTPMRSTPTRTPARPAPHRLGLNTGCRWTMHRTRQTPGLLASAWH